MLKVTNKETGRVFYPADPHNSYTDLAIELGTYIKEPMMAGVSSKGDVVVVDLRPRHEQTIIIPQVKYDIIDDGVEPNPHKTTVFRK